MKTSRDDHCSTPKSADAGSADPAAFSVRTAVDVDLRAFHTDPHLNEGRHEHVWNVQLVYRGEPFRDARCFRAALTQFLDPYQGNDLPEEWWAAEELAKACLCIGTGDPIGCVVTRTGYRAEAWR